MNGEITGLSPEKVLAESVFVGLHSEKSGSPFPFSQKFISGSEAQAKICNVSKSETSHGGVSR